MPKRMQTILVIGAVAALDGIGAAGAASPQDTAGGQPRPQAARPTSVEAAEPQERAAPIRVGITKPVDNSRSTSPAGTPLLVTVVSVSPDPIASLELWADDRRVAVQDAPSPGRKLDAVFAWTPVVPATYSLVARAIDRNGASATSTAVDVIVSGSRTLRKENKRQGPERLISIASGTGGDAAAQPRRVAPDSPLRRPGRATSVGVAERWTAAPPPAGRERQTLSAPQAPELTASTRRCGVELSIRGRSADAEGFHVYRQVPSINDWKRIASLRANPAKEWVTYADGGRAGRVKYYVAAFNARGQAMSNPVAIDVSRAGCPSPPPTASVVSVSFADLKTEAGVERMYCHTSLGGGHKSRWPAAGFFRPGKDGLEEQGALVNVLASSGANASGFSLECWGGAGRQSQRLGTFRQRVFDLQKDHDVPLNQGGLSGRLRVRRDTVMTPFDGTGPSPKPPPGEIVDPRMPRIIAALVHSSQLCKDHLPGKGKSPLEALLFCTPYPEYTLFDAQPYLVWTPNEDQCANGEVSNGADCKSTSWYQARAAQYGGHLGYRIAYEHMSGPYSGLGVMVATTPDTLSAYVIPPLEPYDSQAKHANLCGVTVEYQVQMVYDAGPNDPDYPNLLLVDPWLGLRTWDFNCPTSTGEVDVDVTVQSLRLGSVDDNDGGPDDVELYGYFHVKTASLSGSRPEGMRLLSRWGPDNHDCPSSEMVRFDLPTTGGRSDCPASFANGDHDLAAKYLCDCDDIHSHDGPWLENNNVIRVRVTEGDALIITTVLMDHDHGSSDDNVCVGMIATDSRSLLTWSKTNETGAMVQSNNGSASCKVTLGIRAVAP